MPANGLLPQKMKFRATLFVSAFLIGAVYGFILYRDHIFPYKLLHPEALATAPTEGPLDPAYYELRRKHFRIFPVSADIVMLGDSQIERGEWSRMFPAASIANYGIRGDTISGVRQPLADIHEAKAVFIMAGINDVRFSPSSSKMESEYEEIIRSIPGAEVHILSTLHVAATYPDSGTINARVGELDRLLAAFCFSSQSCLFFDLNDKLAPDGVLREDFTPDGLHLTPRGMPSSETRRLTSSVGGTSTVGQDGIRHSTLAQRCHDWLDDCRRDGHGGALLQTCSARGA